MESMEAKKISIADERAEEILGRFPILKEFKDICGLSIDDIQNLGVYLDYDLVELNKKVSELTTLKNKMGSTKVKELEKKIKNLNNSLADVEKDGTETELIKILKETIKNAEEALKTEKENTKYDEMALEFSKLENDRDEIETMKLRPLQRKKLAVIYETIGDDIKKVMISIDGKVYDSKQYMKKFELNRNQLIDELLKNSEYKLGNTYYFKKVVE